MSHTAFMGQPTPGEATYSLSKVACCLLTSLQETGKKETLHLRLTCRQYNAGFAHDRDGTCLQTTYRPSKRRDSPHMVAEYATWRRNTKERTCHMTFSRKDQAFQLLVRWRLQTRSRAAFFPRKCLFLDHAISPLFSAAACLFFF